MSFGGEKLRKILGRTGNKPSKKIFINGIYCLSWLLMYAM